MDKDDDKPAADPATAEPWWWQAIKAHPVSTASLAGFGLGGLMLLMFFGHLKELPDIDLASSPSLLWALASVGCLVAFYLFAIPLLPAVHAAGTYAKSANACKHAFLLSLPAASAIAVVLFDGPRSDWLIAAPALALGFSFVLRWQMMERNPQRRWRPGTWSLVVDTFMGASAWAVALLLGFVFSVALYGMHGNHVSNLALGAQLALVYATGILSVNFDLKKKKDGWAIVAFGLATFFVSVIASQTPTAIGSAAVKAFGLGERPSRLVVSPKGCEILNQAAGRTVCRVAKGEEAVVVCPAILTSRIGTPYFVQLSPFAATGAWPSSERSALIPLPKDEVLSWPKLKSYEPVAGAAAEAASQPARHATYLNADGLSAGQREWLARACASG